MAKRGVLRQTISLALSGFFVILVACLSLVTVALGIVVLGHLLSYIATSVLAEKTLGIFQYVLIMLAVTCTAGLSVPIVLLARNIQRSTDSLSFLQYDDEDEDEDEDDYDSDDVDFNEDGEELNEFLRKLHKNRNIGPFMSSPKTLDDLCPCGSGLKYKDCCGKTWV